jgi:hypothetical protein
VLLGSKGIVASHGDEVEGLRDAFATDNSPRPARGSRFDLFSDLNQWLLKVLLARAFPPQLLAAPRGPIRTARQLAKLASVSEPTTSRFLAGLREGSWLSDDASLIRVRRVAELLERWRNSRGRGDHEVGMRFVFPPVDALNDLRLRLNPWRPEWVNSPDTRPHASYPGGVVWNEQPRACFGLFAAVKTLAVSKVLDRDLVHGAPVHVFAARIDAQLLDRLRLRRCEAGESVDVYVREPRAPESVFRAAVECRQVPCTDVLQCWLDVSHHAVRGEDQARELLQYIKRDIDEYER